MDSQSAQSAELQLLYQVLLEKKLDFQAKFPLLLQEYQDNIVSIEEQTSINIQDDNSSDTVIKSMVQETRNLYGNKKAARVIAVTQEEIDLVFDKFEQLITNGASTLSQDEQLYLEQQISDIVGYTVTSQIQSVELPYTWGTAASLPHIKRHPTDTLRMHRSIHEAGMYEKRSSYGWLAPLPDLDLSIVSKEEYSLSLPFLYLDTLTQPVEEAILWYKDKKVLVINPVTKKLAAASIMPRIYTQLAKYTVGLSPELSRVIEAWKPPSQGKISFLFIDDPDNTLPLGLIDYEIHL